MLWRLVRFLLPALRLPIHWLITLLMEVVVGGLCLVILLVVLFSCGWFGWVREWWLRECWRLLRDSLPSHRSP